MQILGKMFVLAAGRFCPMRAAHAEGFAIHDLMLAPDIMASFGDVYTSRIAADRVTYGCSQ